MAHKRCRKNNTGSLSLEVISLLPADTRLCCHYVQADEKRGWKDHCMITRDLSKVTHLACDRAGNRLTRDYLVAYFVGMELQTWQDGSSSSLPTLCYHRITEDTCGQRRGLLSSQPWKCSLPWRVQCCVSHLAFIRSSVDINCKDLFAQFMGNNTMIYQCPKEQKKSPITQLRLKEKKREGANPSSINRLHYLYMKMFSASINFPCPSALINRSSCYGNLPNSIMALQRGAVYLWERSR